MILMVKIAFKLTSNTIFADTALLILYLCNKNQMNMIDVEGIADIRSRNWIEIVIGVWIRNHMYFWSVMKSAFDMLASLEQIISRCSFVDTDCMLIAWSQAPNMETIAKLYKVLFNSDYRFIFWIIDRPQVKMAQVEDGERDRQETDEKDQNGNGTYIYIYMYIRKRCWKI